MLSKRVQVLLEKAEYEKLKGLGKKAHMSLGEIFREAVRLYGERLVSRDARLLIVEKMHQLKAPVSDWPRVEQDLLRRRAA